MQKTAQILFRPFSQLYGGITRLRNYLYDQRLLASTRFGLPVLAVGNLTVGGTGKTPHVEYLLRLLQPYKVATLSRGYKRQSKGFILADAQATPAIIGDEPYQYHADFKEVAVAVCEQRVKGIAELQARVPELDVIVLDDAMQHRPVQPSLNILISDFNRPFYKDFVLPAGRLREPRSGAKRADAVIVSKCPPMLNQQEQEKIKQQVARYTSAGVPVFFSTFAYGQPVRIGSSNNLSVKVILVTGIANDKPLKQYLTAQNMQVVEHLAFPDHHTYTAENLRSLQRLLQNPANAGAAILTTRKDAVKLTDASLKSLTEQLPVFYVPIEVQFLADQAAFDGLVLGHVQDFA
ncbi:tetraacyldisaccharide 4'-kinase [Pontibacter akesuensis]|uniref:Tetraacyldisaccharide 4'-kinase n=1 Tax=Pontibacter akesuensis TaxID=388950 RepID=A0A1I7G5R8_9BACT|nr:tetraacyldisaccharide 4'-kinase [Pontibacter akesuensis]GHA58669.1 tetraacyldisaccharide 4'-kinase [Pontibacter akesuensis]SFU43784.1 lipid-A-disaccharide kinase [Pontibacter akesuensis]